LKIIVTGVMLFFLDRFLVLTYRYTTQQTSFCISWL